MSPATYSSVVFGMLVAPPALGDEFVVLLIVLVIVFFVTSTIIGIVVGSVIVGKRRIDGD